MVLVSIIVGLGIAEILTGIARRIRYRHSIVGYWVHWCAIALIFLALLQNWWELWQLRDIAQWSFSSLILMLIGPASLYLLAHLIFPEPQNGADFRDYYYGAMRSMWWLAILAVVSSTVFKPIAFGSALLDMDNVAPALMLIGFLALAMSKNVVLHSILVPAFLLMLIGDVIFWHPVMSLVESIS